MLAIRIVAALLGAHVLPGALLVKGFGVGRGALEKWIMAAVMGGPLGALMYLLALLADSDPLYWAVLGLVDALALTALLRGRSKRRDPVPGLSRGLLVGLLLLVGLVEGAYFATTGYLFRLDGNGNLVMDRALQRDTLFHVGMVRSLVYSYPPELLSISGSEAGYHVGYHLQLAAWSRFFGIDAFDGVYRVGLGWHLALLVLSTFCLARRFTGRDGAGLVITVFLFGAGLGFFFAAPYAHWWSLLFMDAALVSIFLPNPLLPALPLLMVGLSCLGDYLSEPRAGRLAATAVCLAFLFAVKVFLGAQALAGVLLAVAMSRAEERRRLLAAGAVVGIASAPLLWHTLASPGSGNTAVSLRPLEMVRYSMELLGWERGVDSLTRVGGVARGSAGVSDWSLALAAALWWVVGFLGLRVLGLKEWFGDSIGKRDGIHRTMAFMVVIGFPAALLLRVGPADATGPSRLEGINDAFWFATQSGILLWFWTVEALVALAGRGGSVRKATVAAVGCLLAFPCTIQHFVLKQSLDVDRVPADVVDAAEYVRGTSDPGAVWVEPPDRVRPSPVAYLAGRPVVYDGYVGYDYMFAPRDEREFRHHAVAQFWSTEDEAFGTWFLDRYRVKWVYATREKPLPSALRQRAEPRFSNRSVRVYEVTPGEPDGGTIVTPARIPLGMAGESFFGRAWGRPSGRPRTRGLPPGEASLYIPAEKNARLELRFLVRTPHAPGTLHVERSFVELGRLDEEAVVSVKKADERGLRRITLQWTGKDSLIVERIDIQTGGAPNR